MLQLAWVSFLFFFYKAYQIRVMLSLLQSCILMAGQGRRGEREQANMKKEWKGGRETRDQQVNPL